MSGTPAVLRTVRAKKLAHFINLEILLAANAFERIGTVPVRVLQAVITNGTDTVAGVVDLEGAVAAAGTGAGVTHVVGGGRGGGPNVRARWSDTAEEPFAEGTILSSSLRKGGKR